MEGLRIRQVGEQTAAKKFQSALARQARATVSRLLKTLQVVL